MAEDKNITLSINFISGDLRVDITRKLEELYPSMSLDERMSIATNAVSQVLEDIQKYGNGALHHALILYGMQKAAEICKECYDE